MINILHKLYPTIKQESFLNSWLWSSIGIENWVITQIKNELDITSFLPLRILKPNQLRSILSRKIYGHSTKCVLPSRLINDCIGAVLDTYAKMQKKHASSAIYRMHLKSFRKKKSFYFNGDIKVDKKGRIKVPGLKTTLRISEPLKFTGKLKKTTLIKKFDGWYISCCYDQDRKPIEILDGKEAGIDPGLKTSLTFSDETVIDFPRFYQESEETLSKIQRKSKNSKTLKRVHRKLENRRKDHHHKLSTKLAKIYAKLYWSDDRFKELMKLFGKSYSNLGLGSFRDLLSAKLASRIDGFGELIRVDNRNSTRTCSVCSDLTGPTGKNELLVRQWECGSCGSTHDRDVNASVNALLSGKGITPELGNHLSRQSCPSCA